MLNEQFKTDAEQWQAVLDRNQAADGLFYYAVKTTQIYCQPTCPSRRPKRENVSFFATTDEAENAGFRACKRCTPNEVSTKSQAIAAVINLLETASPTPTLTQLGAAVAMSPYHLQRIFKAATGLSPKAYAKALKAERLASALQTGEPVTTAMLDAGYQSSRELYDGIGEDLGMTPTAYKQNGSGTEMAYDLFETVLGSMLIVATDRGVSALRFGGSEMLAEVEKEFPNAKIVHQPTRVAPHIAAVQSYLSAAGQVLDLPLDVNATDFQRRVWAALRQIPVGETRSYKEVAEMIDQPNAVRAVARACATNPVALAVPCHRVVRTGGALSGYRWGVETKRKLLEREADSH